MKFKDKTAIITGGSRGIGKELAIAFLKEGANVVASYRNNEAAANDALQEFNSISENTVISKVDVTDIDQVKQLVKSAVSKFGKIDILYPASEEAGYCTGQIYTVDGGLLA